MPTKITNIKHLLQIYNLFFHLVFGHEWNCEYESTEI